jgi:hypothetical protein
VKAKMEVEDFHMDQPNEKEHRREHDGVNEAHHGRKTVWALGGAIEAKELACWKERIVVQVYFVHRST